MQIIIDGYNLIHTWGWMPSERHPSSLARGRQRMLTRLAQLVPTRARKKVIVVFDAGHWYRIGGIQTLEPNSPTPFLGFDVRFADQYDEADSMIEDLIRRSSNPDKILVVSSDQRLIQAAYRRKATSIRSQDFLDELEKIFPARDGSPNPSDPIQAEANWGSKDKLTQNLQNTDWMTEFNIQANRDLTGADDPQDINPLSNQDDTSETYNPFPPGYGEDLLS